MVEGEESLPDPASPSMGRSDGLDDQLFNKSIVNSAQENMSESNHEIKFDTHSEGLFGKKFISPAALNELNEKPKPLSDLQAERLELKAVLFKPEFNNLRLIKDSLSPAQM